MFKWLKLLRWLGPWCNQERGPDIPSKDGWVCCVQMRFRCRCYRPKSYVGAVMVMPGLHPDGIDDPRLDRFSRVLAGAGMLVFVPELPTMKSSIMQKDVLEETRAALSHISDMVTGEGINSIGVFCISASSIAGLTVANDERWSTFIHRIHLFGGFADWNEALRFSMTGRIVRDAVVENVRIDPLGLPVVYMNMVQTFPDFLGVEPNVGCNLLYGWYKYVARTWEKPQVQHPKDTRNIAHDVWIELTDDNPAMVDFQQIFFQGCAIQSGGEDRVHKYLNTLNMSKRPESIHWLNPRLQLNQLTIPLDISHGRDDFVVPYTQSLLLKDWSSASPTRVFLTGLYHHTGAVEFKRMLQNVLKLPGEIWTSILLVQAISELNVYPRRTVSS